MKKHHLSAKSPATPKLVPDISLAPEEQDQLQNGSVSLSPERITEGVTTKTEVLNEILQQHERLDYSRNWGINE